MFPAGLDLSLQLSVDYFLSLESLLPHPHIVFTMYVSHVKDILLQRFCPKVHDGVKFKWHMDAKTNTLIPGGITESQKAVEKGKRKLVTNLLVSKSIFIFAKTVKSKTAEGKGSSCWWQMRDFSKAVNKKLENFFKEAAWRRLFGRETEAKRCYHPPNEEPKHWDRKWLKAFLPGKDFVSPGKWVETYHG